MIYKSKYTGKEIDEILESAESLNVIDNLNSTSSTDVLSAKQGRVLKKEIDKVAKINTDNVSLLTNATNTNAINISIISGNVETNSENINSLSASVINIENIKNIEVIDNLESDKTTSALSAKQGKELKSLFDNLSIEIDNNAVSNAAITQAVLESKEVTAAALVDLDRRLYNYATKEELKLSEEAIQERDNDINSAILESKEVTAAALVDLDRRINNIMTILKNNNLI